MKAVADAGEQLAAVLRRPGAVPILIVVLWACAVLPNLTVRSFVYEEGTNAEIARDILTRGDFLKPYVYGIRWHEKPSLLAWLIAGFATLTGGVNEWSARLPAMLSVLITALLVQRVTRRYASPNASLFAALAFLFSPLLLQKLAVAEPDTLVTVLSFAAFVVWWDGVASGRLGILRWLGCGLLLATLAMAKGPQPAGFFVCAVTAYLLIERRWGDLPGWLLCMIMPAAAVAAWGAAVYRPGDEAVWLSYARLDGWPPLGAYVWRNIHNVVSLFVELAPASLMLPFIPWPWRNKKASDIPPIVAPLILYSGLCTLILFAWPGYNSRYAMPMAPSLAVLAAIAWDRLAMPRFLVLRSLAVVVLGCLIAYQFILFMVIAPLFPDRFGESRLAGTAIDRAIHAQPAPAYCLRLDTNVFFHVTVPLRCLDLSAMAALTPPMWLLMPDTAVAEFAKLRPDRDVRIVLHGLTDQRLAAAYVTVK
jgi:4-amino-4-deoxy-L-arabinose transferase-like glycosyltransferase